MNTTFQPEVLIQNLGPDVKSYVYQILNEFSAFITPETVAQVVAKDPLELWKRRSDYGEEFPKTREELARTFRIEISLSESGGTLSAEGIHLDVYEALKQAKEKLLKMLDQIQDDVVSNQDRYQQIQQALSSGSTIH